MQVQIPSSRMLYLMYLFCLYFTDKYLRMPLEEKRKFYKCGSKFVTLDQVEAWTVYAERIIKKYSKFV